MAKFIDSSIDSHEAIIDGNFVSMGALFNSGYTHTVRTRALTPSQTCDAFCPFHHGNSCCSFYDDALRKKIIPSFELH